MRRGPASGDGAGRGGIARDEQGQATPRAAARIVGIGPKSRLPVVAGGIRRGPHLLALIEPRKYSPRSGESGTSWIGREEHAIRLNFVMRIADHEIRRPRPRTDCLIPEIPTRTSPAARFATGRSPEPPQPFPPTAACPPADEAAHPTATASNIADSTGRRLSGQTTSVTLPRDSNPPDCADLIEEA
jgi:hypothetical protein